GSSHAGQSRQSPNQAGEAAAVPRRHRARRPGLRARRARLPALQRDPGHAGPERLLLLRDLQRRRGAGCPPRRATLRRLAQGVARGAGRRARANTLRDDLSSRPRLLGQDVAMKAALFTITPYLGPAVHSAWPVPTSTYSSEAAEASMAW